MHVVHRAWRWYFWALVGLFVLDIGLEVVEGVAARSFESFVSTILGYAWMALGLACLYGYVWQVRLGKQLIWALLFWANFLFALVGVVFVIFVMDMMDPRGWSDLFVTTKGVYVGAAVLGVALTVPLFIANFRYAFRSKHLWEK